MSLGEQLASFAQVVAAELKGVRTAIARLRAPEWKVISGNYTLLPEDAGKVLVAPDASAPTTIAVAPQTFQDMERVDVVVLTAQPVSFAGTGGLVLSSSTGSTTARTKYSAMSLLWLDLEWALVVGDLVQP